MSASSQLPREHVNVPPSRGSPATAGTVRFSGARGLTDDESAPVIEPMVTRQEIEWLTSAALSAYVGPVLPATGVPSRRHWKLVTYAGTPSSSHVPRLHVSVCPSRRSP